MSFSVRFLLMCVLIAGVVSFTPAVPRLNVKSTQLNAIGALARKAKEAEVKKWIEEGGREEVKGLLGDMEGGESEESEVAGVVKEAIHKRRRTLSIVAEYKRKFKADGYVNEIFEPNLMSPLFREFGASACAVMTDKRVGGCDYTDLKTITEEQEKARGDVPGPLPVICSDMIVMDEQIARAKINGAQAVLLQLGLLNEDVVKGMMEKAARIGLETIIQANTEEEVKTAISLNAKIIKVNSIEDIEVKESWRTLMGDSVTAIADVLANDNKQLEEVEEAWKLRDAGYQAVWVSDCLYKSGNDPTEHAGA
eukprot:CAMPEP_0182502586 /NCGR_PEP_ID=MMETSP1321-20130603/13731_1 /TAXON_ID=91990 /ORGANISM="Bolidomonas sp., Strain RCC1657" /LENGTH=308 /DNA_ID=CAMNT_0024707553 /DNA_START=109 /DNA_END=1032 /DNA_ORIENTATION=-